MDLIDRQAALNMKFSHGINENGLLYVPFGEMMNNLKQLPSAQPERKGKWETLVRHIDGATFVGDVCSICGWWKAMGAYNYCPNCGADMRGEDHER